MRKTISFPLPLNAILLAICFLSFPAVLTAQEARTVSIATANAVIASTQPSFVTKNLFTYSWPVPAAYMNSLQRIAWLSAGNLHFNMPDGLVHAYPFLPSATTYQIDQSALRFIEAAPQGALLVLDIEYQTADAPFITPKVLLRWAKIAHAIRPDLIVTTYGVWGGAPAREWTADEYNRPGNHPGTAPTADQAALLNECDVLNYDVYPTGPAWEQRDLDFMNIIAALGHRYLKDKPTCYTIRAPRWADHTVANFTAKYVDACRNQATRWIVFDPQPGIDDDFIGRVIKMAHR